MVGLLRVTGTIDINQFWPTGMSPSILSDADTIHVKIDPATAFVFNGDVTHAFDFAWIKTRTVKVKKPAPKTTKKPEYVIVSQTDKSKAHIKVRLQGIDAPELHYHDDQKAPEVRQNWGKRAASELRKFLKGLGSGMKIDCRVETFVTSPNDVFDKYGRFVGDILVVDGTHFRNVNHWLLEKGWAFPAHYNSMQLGEIDKINAIWAKAKGGIIKFIDKRARDDMYGLPAGKAGDSPSDANKDKGKVVFPKLFRRLVRFHEHPKGATTLEQFLKTLKSDQTIPLATFKTLTPKQRARPTKKNGVQLTPFHQLVTDGNRLDPKPESFVVVEVGPNLKNSNGPVTSWNDQGVPVAEVP